MAVKVITEGTSYLPSSIREELDLGVAGHEVAGVFTSAKLSGTIEYLRRGDRIGNARVAVGIAYCTNDRMLKSRIRA